MYLFRLIISLIVFPMLSWSQEALPEAKVTYQQIRRSSRRDLEVRINVELAAIGNSSKAESFPVTFTVKNLSKTSIGLGRYGDDYTQNVEIFQADRIAELPDQNRLFPFAGAGGGSAKEIAPGESLSFVVPVPISLFKMKDVQFFAGVRYGVRIGENEGFVGEALSEPFSLPLIPALLAPTPSATPKGASQPPTPSKPVPAVVPAPTFPASAVAESSPPVVERKSVVWRWLVGMLVLFVIVAVALKRRA